MNNITRRKKKSQKTIFSDSSGKIYFIKRVIVFILGLYTYRRYNGFNELQISGTENLQKLPKTHVMFVSNHQTYVADAIAMYHVFNSFKNGFNNTIKDPVYLLNPLMNFYFVAASETMKEGIMQRIMSYAGAVTINRSWRSSGVNVERGVDKKGIEAITHALNNGWLVNFPQGTTRPFAPGRKGVAHLIKDLKPIVVPIVIDGFRRSFDKKGLLIKKKGIKQKFQIKPVLQIDYENETIDEILEKVMESIEQTERFMKVPEIKAIDQNEAQST
jgi:1-acyl-sn-glycerol-3-phosphate acyltransferase